MAVTFTATLEQAEGKQATGIRVPDDAVAALGAGRRPKVVATLAGYTYRSSVAPMGGASMLPVSAEVRQAAGVRAGDVVEVTLEVDAAPRTVEVPADLAEALAAKPGAAEAFAALAPSAQKEAVRQVETAKAAETRQRRVAAIVERLG